MHKVSVPHWTVVPTLALALALVSVPAPALALDIVGIWELPSGTAQVARNDHGYVGILMQPSASCPALVPGMEVLHGSLLDDAFSGEVRLCLEGPSCTTKESFLTTLLVVSPSSEKMSGAIELGGGGCMAQVGKRGGFALHKIVTRPKPDKPRAPKAQESKASSPTSAKTPTSTPTSTSVPDNGTAPVPDASAAAQVNDEPPLDPKKVDQARDIMRDAEQYMKEGSFEKARKRFEEARALAKLPEAYNGIGVTYYARGEYDEALKSYKQALEVDPNFGDAYYNIGCIYSVLNKADMAIRYLRLSVANGYKAVDEMEDDHDLDGIRSDPRFQELMKKAAKGSSHP